MTIGSLDTDEMVQNDLNKRRGSEAGVVEVYQNDKGYGKMLKFMGEKRFKLVLDVINAVSHDESKLHLFDSEFFEHLEHFSKEFENKEDVRSEISDYDFFCDEIILKFWDAIYKDGTPHADVNLFFIEQGH